MNQTISRFDTHEEKRTFSDFCGLSYYNIESRMDEKVIQEINQNPWPLIESVDYDATPIEKPTAIQSSGRITYKRDPIVSKRALARAEFKCEISENHPSFLRRLSSQLYTEPHHLIPMSQQGEFDYSLDVEANIVSLCSNCHNQNHYGEGTAAMIKSLFEKRKGELSKAKIEITLEDLLAIYYLEDYTD